MHFRLALLFAVQCSVAAAGEITLPAADYSAGSEGVVGSDPNWGELLVCHGEAGWQEWSFECEEPGRYYLHAYYASGDERPLRVSINGEPAYGEAFAEPTGGFYPEHLTWATVGPVDLRRGENVLRVEALGFTPHLAGWVLSTDPEEWDRKAFAERFPDPIELVTGKVAQIEAEMAATRRWLIEEHGFERILFIKRNTYTANHYYTEFINSRWLPGGGLFVLDLRDGSVREVAPELASGVTGRMDLACDAERVLFGWKTGPDQGYRIHEIGIDGGGLRRVLNPPSNEAELIERYRNGYHHGTDDMHPCYLPDGSIVFISTRCQAGTLCDGIDSFTTTVLYRMNADGSGLRQLSHGALSEGTPSLLPDGRIIYTRWEYVDKGAVSAKGLWAIRPDGTGTVEVYGNSLLLPPTLLQARAAPGGPNSFVALGSPHYPQNALGTVLAIDTSRPLRSEDAVTYLTPQVKILAEWGWDYFTDEAGEGIRDTAGHGPLFRDPYPLEGGDVLVSHKPEGYGGSYAFNGYGLYLLGPDGSLSPVYHDPLISSWQPIPLRPRPRPPVLASAIDPELAEQGLARCVVTDVYRGMGDVEPGTIRHLRVLEQVARPWSARRHGRLLEDEYDQQHAVVSKDTALGLKVLHGVVPVEPDGSAHFLVPADANIFFQALDENYLAVQTERTFVNYMAGETRSCIGCHETPEVAAPRPRELEPLALTRQASMLAPQPGDASPGRPLHYPADVQPIWDRHCIECHNGERTEGGLDLTGTPTRMFSVSYEALLTERRGARQDRVEPGLVPTIGENHPKVGNVAYLPPRSLGSHASLLMAMLMPEAIHLEDPGQRERLHRLLDAHEGIELSQPELVRIATWVDTNAQYYGSYFGRRNLADEGHANFRPVPTWESALGTQPLPEGQR
jgi:hypothetical protein